jgi:hypothetical protein
MADFNLATDTFTPAGRQILHRFQIDDFAIVMCVRDEEGLYAPYVVWRIDPTSGNCFWGTYHVDKADAAAQFRKRAAGTMQMCE